MKRRFISLECKPILKSSTTLCEVHCKLSACNTQVVSVCIEHCTSRVKYGIIQPMSNCVSRDIAPTHRFFSRAEGGLCMEAILPPELHVYLNQQSVRKGNTCPLAILLPLTQ